ncbi:MAG: cytochrome P450 [Actinomycetota bacterium]|nr:cytochrome P450 [Actinomycetota bacterium]MEC9467359.1 cytochrome P450 [Actinomycetota bacterium]MED5394840.1 cytochrome P450 [Actinomycetota bacterium]MED6327996.1 cytochrome P450 [Actinomycetota bacterium]MEE2957709.1 cytochrome P450 [Actinomycetota bacterium]
MTLVDRPMAGSDLADPATYDRGIPHERFAELRATPGLVRNPDGPWGTAFWSVTRLDDLVAVSRDPTTFSSAVGHIQIYDVDEDVRDARASMIDLDPPIHTRLRRLVSSAFTPKHVQDYVGDVRRRIGERLDALEAAGGGDWVAEVAAPIPIGVICALMGVPEADHDLMIEMTDHLVEGTSSAELDPGAYGNTKPLRELPFNSPAAFGVEEYARRARRDRLADPRDDLLTQLAVAEVDGERLSETEYARFFQLMIFAGNETTRSAMAHLAVHLVDHEEQFDQVRADGDLLDGAVEEVVRHSSPILYFRRTATVDTVLAGTEVAAGEKVVMWYASANFDEAHFVDPLVFDVDRPRVPGHVAFGGGGAHFCLGASLARIELAELVAETLRRGLRIQLAGEPEMVSSNFVNGVARLPIEVSR